MNYNNQLAPQKEMTLNQYLRAPAVVTMLSEKLGLKESKLFGTALASATMTNKKLMECTNDSLLNSAMIGHSLGLPPSPQLGYYYMVPYKNKGVMEANFQIGYKGYIQLAMRSGSYKKLNVVAVKQGEFVAWNPLTETFVANFMDDPVEREGAATIGYCGFFQYTNGFEKTVYWTRQAIETHADKYSMAYSLDRHKLLKAGKVPSKDMWKYSSFWYKDFDVMALKTVIRNMLSKWGIMSVEMQSAYEQDVQAECLSYDQVQAQSQNTIADKAGSEVTEANFEDQQPEKEPEPKVSADGINEDWM
jgi:recombination protein RecT